VDARRGQIGAVPVLTVRPFATAFTGPLGAFWGLLAGPRGSLKCSSHTLLHLLYPASAFFSLPLNLGLHFMDLALHLPDALVGLLNGPAGPFGSVGVLDRSRAGGSHRGSRLRPDGGLLLLPGRHPQAGGRPTQGVGLAVQLGLIEFVGHPLKVERRVLEQHLRRPRRLGRRVRGEVGWRTRLVVLRR
jgi:hypothetical protein